MLVTLEGGIPLPMVLLGLDLGAQTDWPFQNWMVYPQTWQLLNLPYRNAEDFAWEKNIYESMVDFPTNQTSPINGKGVTSPL